MIQDVLSSSAANPPIKNEMKGKILLARLVDGMEVVEGQKAS
jgi:hypothetical protein